MEKNDFLEIYELLEIFSTRKELKKKDVFKGRDFGGVWERAKKDEVIIKTEKNLFTISEKGAFFYDFLKKREDVITKMKEKNYEAMEKIYGFIKKKRPDINLYDGTIYTMERELEISNRYSCYDPKNKNWTFLWEIPKRKVIDLTKKVPLKSNKSIYGETPITIIFENGEVYLDEEEKNFVNFLDNEKNHIEWYFRNDDAEEKKRLNIEKDNGQGYSPTFVVSVKKEGLMIMEFEKEGNEKKENFNAIKAYAHERDLDIGFSDNFLYIISDGKGNYYRHKGNEFYDKKTKPDRWKKIKKIKSHKNPASIAINGFLSLVLVALVLFALLLSMDVVGL